jgi:hypothetical protein
VKLDGVHGHPLPYALAIESKRSPTNSMVGRNVDKVGFNLDGLFRLLPTATTLCPVVRSMGGHQLAIINIYILIMNSTLLIQTDPKVEGF